MRLDQFGEGTNLFTLQNGMHARSGTFGEWLDDLELVLFNRMMLIRSRILHIPDLPNELRVHHPVVRSRE